MGHRNRSRLLLLVLLLLVTPVEAVDDGAAVAGAAAAGLLAAGVKEAVNFWEGVEEDTAGDLRVLEKQRGTLRIMATNLRRVKRERGTQDMAESVWRSTLTVSYTHLTLPTKA